MLLKEKKCSSQVNYLIQAEQITFLFVEDKTEDRKTADDNCSIGLVKHYKAGCPNGFHTLESVIV